MSVESILHRTGPRRLLAIDGGGVRGFIALGVLGELEASLRHQLGRDDIVLADVFDYVAGAGTGAIIATGLSMGLPVAQINAILSRMSDIFDARYWARQFTFRTEDTRLRATLNELVGEDTRLDDSRLRTLLMVVMRNRVFEVPFLLTNNPRTKYNDPSRPDSNIRMPLAKVLRASCPAPTYYPPEVFELGRGSAALSDGTMTIYRNPAHQLFIASTALPYRLSWETGASRILLVSVGVGRLSVVEQSQNIEGRDSLSASLLDSAAIEQDFLCRAYGRTISGHVLDREVGDMREPTAGPRLFTYLRYEADLSFGGLSQLGLGHIDPEEIQSLYGADNIADLQAIGQAVGRAGIRPEQFVGFVD
jgi:uncharacterized protein